MKAVSLCFAPFPSFVFCTFCRMPNYLAIDAHPLPAGEARVEQPQEDFAEVVLMEIKGLHESHNSLSGRMDKLQLQPN